MDEKDRDLYAAAGLALRWAQLFEAEVVTVALLHGVARGIFKTRAEAEIFVTNEDKRPLRKLLREILAHVRFEPDVTATFDAAIETRNSFVHRFFWDNAESFANDNRRDKLLAKLKEHQQLFYSAHKFASLLTELYKNQVISHDQL